MLDLYINCDVVVTMDSLFRLTVSNLPNAVDCLFSWSGCKCACVCVKCKQGECSSGWWCVIVRKTEQDFILVSYLQLHTHTQRKRERENKNFLICRFKYSTRFIVKNREIIIYLLVFETFCSWIVRFELRSDDAFISHSNCKSILQLLLNYHWYIKAYKIHSYYY